MVSLSRRKNACRLSLRPSASSARARSAADQVRSAVISTKAIWSRVHVLGVALWTPNDAIHRPPLISGVPTNAAVLPARSCSRSAAVNRASVLTSSTATVSPRPHASTMA